MNGSAGSEGLAWKVIGSSFADVLTGSHRTLELSGQDGDHVITGGTGAELLFGGDGNDRIDARDGAADPIDCGGQLLDWAAVDSVEASITGCAQVTSCETTTVTITTDAPGELEIYVDQVGHGPDVLLIGGLGDTVE